ncbi:MAG: flavin reductase family protein [Actinomycetota bacterium]|jgi:flavin reductase (DIM6/NTAB) family NADH-FMN oxidoreductase RutF
MSGADVMVPAEEDLVYRFKQAMRRFPSGVTVVTAHPPGPPQAITVSAFCSVSLEPPLVLVCLNRNGRAATAIANSPAFAVNFLSEEQTDDSRACTSPVENRLAEVAWRPGSNGAPILVRATAALECRRHALFPAGDHVILVGEVTNTHLHEPTRPLAYHDGGYCRVSPHVLAG